MKKKILIIEDEVDIAELLREIFQLHGYAVVLAFDGRDGLSKAASERPDVVLTDIMVPFVDGLELIDALQQDPVLCTIPIIAMSATEDVAHRPFLRKPFSVGVLIDLVERLLDNE